MQHNAAEVDNWVQVRLRGRDLEVVGESPLQEWFFQYTNESMWMDRQAFEAWAKECGHPTSVCLWLSKEVSKIAAEVRAISALQSQDTHNAAKCQMFSFDNALMDICTFLSEQFCLTAGSSGCVCPTGGMSHFSYVCRKTRSSKGTVLT